MRVEVPNLNVKSAMTADPSTPVRLNMLRQEALVCTRCPLAGGRTRVVFGKGRASSRLMVVGEAPGADEDRRGSPFVGRAGRVLDKLLPEIGVKRADVYVANVVMCRPLNNARPPRNRRPARAEIEKCAPYLAAQLAAVNPSVVIALGNTASRHLLATSDGIIELRKREHEVGNTIVVPTLHPSALNRRSGWRQHASDDFKRAKRCLDQAADLG